MHLRWPGKTWDGIRISGNDGYGYGGCNSLDKESGRGLRVEEKMNNIAIITARGGSKRIPKKNIKDFCGKPIIAYSIEAALKAGIFDEVMVSTDSEEIRDIALEYGASVPFMRSEKTSSDTATTADVIGEVIERYRSTNREFDFVSCIYPTAPFITSERLKDAWEKLKGSKADAIMSVVRFSFPPQRALVVREGRLSFQYPEYADTRSQDLEPVYHDCGQFYICRTEEFLKHHSMVVPGMTPYIMPEEEVQDIDTFSDWKVAEAKYRAMQGSNEKTNIKSISTFFSEEELKNVGLKCYGENVKISRNAVLYNPDLLEVGNNVRIDDFTTISGKVILGDYIHIAQFCGLYGGTEGIFMDDFSGLSSKVIIYATSNDYSGESMTNPTVPEKYKPTDKNMPVHIGKHVVIGAASVILPGITIGEGSAVGSMTMVIKSLDPWGIYAGSPAKRIKERKKTLLELEKKLRDETSVSFI